jgi:glycosyltransferase involved in cell wall biosynthesis
MRILLASFIAPSESTGMGKWTARISRELERRGHSIDLIFAPTSSFGGARIGRHAFGSRLALEIIRRRRTIDVAVIHEPHAAESTLLQHLGGARVVVMSHGVELRVEEDLDRAANSGAASARAFHRWRHAAAWGWREHIAFKLAASTLVLSEADRRFLIDRLGLPTERVVQFTNGADDPPFVAKPEHGTLVLCIGTWIPEKGSMTLPRIWREVRAHRPATQLLVAGTGLEEQTVLADFSEQDRASVKVIPRFGGPDELRSFVEKAAVFILPSLREGSPLALLEAMSYGIPPVAAAVGGVPEIISRSEEGMLYPPDQVGLAARHVLELLQDDQRRRVMGLAARDRTKELTWSAAAEAVERACEAALRGS